MLPLDFNKGLPVEEGSPRVSAADEMDKMYETTATYLYCQTSARLVHEVASKKIQPTSLLAF